MVEVWDGDGTDVGGQTEHLGRALLPAAAVRAALAFSYAEGGEGATVTLPLRDRPMAEERVAKGDVTVTARPPPPPSATSHHLEKKKTSTS